ncbi:MAG: phosphate ABC transporter, permease protein PstA [Alphaproteobacteria bacterium]|nr:phosphate ABC transporter, permease protein PstA [Alphaproteobacteria bacterium]|tara:strand:+ start:508 stop:1812 length:1305 start_codon:yes stop_codon:yes gene_type:complete
MTDFPADRSITRKPDFSDAHLRRRYRAEARFRMYGIAAIFAALAMLAVLLGSIVSTGSSAFTQTEMALDIHLDAALIDPDGTRDPAILAKANYRKIVRDAMRAQFPDVSGRRNQRSLFKIISSGSDFDLRQFVEANTELIGTTQTIWFKTSADIDQLAKGAIPRDVPEGDRRVKDAQIGWFDTLDEDGRIRRSFNTTFFTSGDSREPEQAGVWGAVVGTALTLAVTLVLSFPIGVMAAVYLEEFAPKNRWTDLIEVNINNLAAVPSIVFGLLGLAVFLNFFGLPRSAPLVGGLVLALMTLPTVIIAGRAALQSVPRSIREAALGVGASPLQTVSHHVLPLAMPGILTGTIIGMARALGETAPLLMIGMVAFIVDIPRGFTDAATVLPVQVFLWADAPERAFVERTSAAIIVLLAFLIIMNLAAVLLRRKFERRW